VKWAFEVVTLCQRAVLQAHAPDPGAFIDAIELLASRLPAPTNGAERIFLADRLREVTARTTWSWSDQSGNDQRGAFLPARSWPSGPVLDDPRSLLLAWLRQNISGLHTRIDLPPAVRAALEMRSTPGSSLNLDSLAASVRCSRSVLTRSFRKVLGVSVGQYLRRVRIRKAIVWLSTTQWSVGSIARLVGYRGTNNLYVALRSVTCLTPSEIRCASAAVIGELLDALLVPMARAESRRNSSAATSTAAVGHSDIKTTPPYLNITGEEVAKALTGM
jgi:AraC-like DNA-binding protein